MSEDTDNRRKAASVLIGPSLTLVAIIVGIWQFNVGEENRQLLEFRRASWTQKLQAYQDVASIVGEIVAQYDSKKVAGSDDSYKKFLTAYWGAMILVEDKGVDRAMKRFFLELRDVRSGWSKNSDELKIAADALMKECRRSIESERPVMRPFGVLQFLS